MKKPSFLVFVVEDDEWYNKLLVHSLSLNPEFEVRRFFNGKELLNAMHERPDVITLDYRLPDMNGEVILKKLKEIDPLVEIIIISEQENISTAVDLLKLGAYDYIVKSKDIKDRILTTISNIQHKVALKNRITNLQREVQEKYTFEKSIIGKSKSIKRVFDMMEKAVKTNITVSISGETGTGKELVAKAIHFNSARKTSSFVAINVAAIPAELIESELFGYEKGAFTGATTARKGKFEEANGGTLFLDEIGEMVASAQVKLLRVLQEKEVVRVGGNKTIKVDCRIVVATHKNLMEEVKAGRFREDLYYRLFGLPIQLPTLRERDDDCLLLSQYLMDKFCEENNLPQKYITEEARAKIMHYSWPGNVRELKSVIELAVVLSNSDEIKDSDITLLGNEDLISDLLLKEETMRNYSIKIVQHFLSRYDNDTKKVAELLDIGQTTVYRLLKEAKQQAE